MIKDNKILTKEEEDSIFSNTFSMNLEENMPLDKILFLNEVCDCCEIK
jgi:hypothetical protein